MICTSGFFDAHAKFRPLSDENQRKTIDAEVLVYVNKFVPTRMDLELFKQEQEIPSYTTSILPKVECAIEGLVHESTTRSELLVFSFEYCLTDALRVIPTDEDSIADALERFDTVVKRIETCRGREVYGTPIRDAWERNPADESTCTVCDSRTFCPDYQVMYAGKNNELQPRLPGVKAKA